MFLYFANLGCRKRLRRSKIGHPFYVETVQGSTTKTCSTDRPNVTLGQIARNLETEHLSTCCVLILYAVLYAGLLLLIRTWNPQIAHDCLHQKTNHVCACDIWQD